MALTENNLPITIRHFVDQASWEHTFQIIVDIKLNRLTSFLSDYQVKRMIIEEYENLNVPKILREHLNIVGKPKPLTVRKAPVYKFEDIEDDEDIMEKG